jgi:hypothetical protein
MCRYGALALFTFVASLHAFGARGPEADRQFVVRESRRVQSRSVQASAADVGAAIRGEKTRWAPGFGSARDQHILEAGARDQPFSAPSRGKYR